MRPMVDSHHSGRYDATPGQWRAMLAELMAADVSSGTEGAKISRRWLPRGVDMFRAGDAFVAWRTERFLELGSFPVWLTLRSWSPGGGIVRHGVPMACALLEDREDGSTLLRGAYHGPSGIQGGAGWSDKPEDRDNVRAGKEVLEVLQTQLPRAHYLLRPDHVTIQADVNAHVGLAEWQHRLNVAVAGVPDMRVIVPPAPTHHGRKIDVAMTTLPLRDEGGRDVGPRVDGFDHHRNTIRTRKAP